MKPLGDPCRHYWLVQDMARATDVQLVPAFREGRLSAREWAGMVDRCRGCDWVEGCRSWLSQPDRRDAIPEKCRNRARFALLKLEQELDRT